MSWHYSFGENHLVAAAMVAQGSHRWWNRYEPDILVVDWSRSFAELCAQGRLMVFRG